MRHSPEHNSLCLMVVRSFVAGRCNMSDAFRETELSIQAAHLVKLHIKLSVVFSLRSRMKEKEWARMFTFSK